jgi:hypothetical protein
MDDLPLRRKSTKTFVDKPADRQSSASSPCPRIAEVDINCFFQSQEPLDLDRVDSLTAITLLNCLIVKLLEIGSAEDAIVVDSNDSCDSEIDTKTEDDSPLSPKKRRWSDDKETQVFKINSNNISGAKSPSSAEKSFHLVKRFYLKKDPGLSATAYLERINQYCKLSTAVYLAATHYLYKLIVEWESLKLSNLNVHRLLIAALRVSCKTLEDINHRQAFIARIGGVNTGDLLGLEIAFLFLLKFDCQVDQGILEKTIGHIKQLYYSP